MTDYQQQEIIIGDSVTHRFRPQYPKGKIMKIDDGCNAVCWVDFGELVLDKPHYTICSKFDLIKNIS